MTSQVSESNAVKYRPNTLEKIVGQKGAVDQIKGIEKSGKVPHGILIVGPTGAGKTTLARIIAAVINGKEKAAKDDPNVQEYNIGEMGRIDDIRELISTMKFLPAAGKFRVILLDEVHALTAQAKSALLKPLEEPPSHVVFILCTDQPEKLLPTIRNRCVTIKLDYLTEEEIYTVLKRVYKLEKLDFGDKAKKILGNIAKVSAGQPRISIQLLQAAANIWASGNKDAAEVLKLSISQSDVFQNDQVALKFLITAYLGAYDKTVKSLGDTKDHAGLLIVLLELNKYMVEIGSGRDATYVSPARRELSDILRKKNAMPDIKKILKVHSALVDAKHKAGTYMVPEYHLLVDAVYKLSGGK